MDEIALPACHLLYQFIPHMETMTLDLCMTQRSCDLFLGIPYNVASCNALLVLVARMTGYQPGKFVHHMNHVHIYENHLDQVDELLKREHRPLPTLAIAKDVPSIYTHPEADVVAYLDKVKPEDFILSGYDPHPALAAPMAV